MVKQKHSGSSKIDLSVAIATHNEEENISDCLASIKSLAGEILIVDGNSQDKTVAIAESFGAKVIITENPPIFHINKQKALDSCKGKWILQLDADERVSEKLAGEIKMIISFSPEEIEGYQKNLAGRRLFKRHQTLLEKRDGVIGIKEGDYIGFFIPRLNFFLGKCLKHGGAYPDGVIRLFKKGYAYFPAKSVHEQIVVEGRVGWLQNDLIHMADPTFKRYLERNSRYIDLLVAELKEKRVKKNAVQLLNFILLKPIWWFFLTQLRHKGILDGMQGVIFSFFSALRFPRAYFRYLRLNI